MPDEGPKNIFSKLQEEIADREHVEELLSPSSLLTLPSALSEILRQLIRLGETTADQLAREIQQDVDETKAALDELASKGYVTRTSTYKVPLGRKRATKLPGSIWESLEEKL